MVFKHFPLGFHKHAMLAAQASIAAEKQGKFWAYHDLLFANGKKLKRSDLLGYAKRLGLDEARFVRDMDAKEANQRVQEDKAEGRRLGVRGTPTLFLEGKELKRVGSFQHLRQALNRALRKVGYKESDLPKDLSDSALVPVRGNPKAKVIVTKFADFECVYCARTARGLREFVNLYQKYVKLEFRHLPLRLHKNARMAAVASVAAHEQGKFWEYHDLLFAHQKKLQRADLFGYAKMLKLDMAKFSKALNAARVIQRVRGDLRLAERLRALGTPTIFINGVRARRWSFEALKRQVDRLLLAQGVKESELPKRPPIVIPLGRSPAKGNANAPITVVEFSDFECPYCSRATRRLDVLYKEFKGHIRIVFKQFPLRFHKNAHLAAQAALAAHEQGKFWAYHELLFANQRFLTRSDLEGYAQQLRLDLVKFKAALNSGKYKKQVAAEKAFGFRIGVGGTPTLYVNGQRLRSYALDAMRAKFQAILKAHKKTQGPTTRRGENATSKPSSKPSSRGVWLGPEVISPGRVLKPKEGTRP